MRPIDKGDGSSYTATIPNSFDFGRYGATKKDAYEYCVTEGLLIATPPETYTALSSDCLNFWLNVVKNGIDKKPTSQRTDSDKKILTVKEMILDKVTAVYKQAGVPMVQTIGDFCCYCDTPIPGLLEVEHRCPKSQYPTFSMNWGNFLMSCGPCNNTKRDNPDRATVESWPKIDPIENEDDYKDEIINHYEWADIDANPYDYIVPALYANQSGSWIEVAEDYALDLNNIVVSYDLTSRTVKANLYAKDKQPFLNVDVCVLIKKVSTGTRSDIIDLCGLNNPGNTDSTYDRRMVNRTKAWFTVLQTVKPLSLIDYSIPQGQELFDILWSTVLITAASTGFFSVWLMILKHGTDPSGVNLGKRFALESNHPNLFPGTNTSFFKQL